jgi:tetratricopeptide (TPR) repeat protein
MAIKLPWLKFNTCQLLVCLLCIHGCSTVNQGRLTPGDLADDLPPAVELSQTPFFPQTEHQCGPAALATVLQSHNVDVSPNTLSSQLYIPGRKGSLQIEIAVTARRYSMLPYPLKPEFGDLLAEIAAGNPVLVLQNLGFDWWPQWHYAVVIGYDITDKELTLRSGTTKRWQTTFTVFERTWRRADNWALVIVPAGEIPATASINSYLKTANAFEQTGLSMQALEAYRAAANTWPDDTTSWQALGNMAYLTGNYDEAVSALLRAASLSPDDEAAWNNLAYALQMKGCTEQALQSLHCALQLSADDENIRDSEQEIRNMAVQSQAGNCPEIACQQPAGKKQNQILHFFHHNSPALILLKKEAGSGTQLLPPTPSHT